jgi:hypothetical protein
MNTVTTTGIDTRDMLLIHRVIRREIGLLPGLIRGAHDRARAARVAAHASEMLDFLHVHHTGEDELLWPGAAAAGQPGRRPDRPDGGPARRDRRGRGGRAPLAAGLGRLSRPEAGEKMAARIEAAGHVLTVHLAEEEDRVLPLAAAHFSQQEWDALGKHGFAAIPGKRRLVILGHILLETDEAERQRFLRQVMLL